MTDTLEERLARMEQALYQLQQENIVLLEHVLNMKREMPKLVDTAIAKYDPRLERLAEDARTALGRLKQMAHQEIQKARRYG